MEDTSRVSRLWRDILSVASGNVQMGNFYPSKIRIVAGNGSRIRFWADNWVGDQCLKALFPRLFMLSTEKEDSLGMLLEKKGDSEVWVLTFRRPLRAWEMAEVRSLNIMLNAAMSLVTDLDDCLRWLASPSGEFSVASMYNRNETDVISIVPP